MHGVYSLLFAGRSWEIRSHSPPNTSKTISRKLARLHVVTAVTCADSKIDAKSHESVSELYGSASTRQKLPTDLKA